MSPSLQFAVIAIESLAEAHGRLSVLRRTAYVDLAVKDAAEDAVFEAEARAAEAIRDAVSGPKIPGSWNGKHHGNRGLRIGENIYLVVEPDGMTERASASVQIVAVNAIAGLDSA